VRSISGEAILELFPPEGGGLTEPLRSGNRSLLLHFGEQEPDETIGAVVELLDVDELAPGDSGRARLVFWTDQARIYGSRGAAFSVRYGREVGRGTIVVPVE
jgi:hypothetical protein